jgi:hypothetical protein
MHIALTDSCPSAAPTRLTTSAAVGLLVWVTSLVPLQTEWAATWLTFATLVIVPLALSVTTDVISHAPRLWRLASLAQPLAAIILTVSFSFDPNPITATLAIPWLIVTLLLAGLGLASLRQTGWASLDLFAKQLALMFIAIGGTWTVITRGGWRPLGFSSVIVELTAVHFHYAAFVLPILAGFCLREFPTKSTKLAVVGVLTGVPLTAVGITISPIVELFASMLVAISASIVAVAHLRLAVRAKSPAQLLLWLISGMSLLGGMALAALYAWAHFTGATWLDIPRMLPTHGALNAIGFAGCGLLAWRGHLRATLPHAKI